MARAGRGFTRLVPLLVTAVFVAAGCRAGGTWESSAEFRLQNVEAAVMELQEELKALEANQAEGDERWNEVRRRLDELTALLRSGRPGGAAPSAASSRKAKRVASIAPPKSLGSGHKTKPDDPAPRETTDKPVKDEKTPEAEKTGQPPKPSESGKAGESGRRIQKRPQTRPSYPKVQTRPKLWEALPPSALSEQGRARAAASAKGEKVVAVVGGAETEGPAQPAPAPPAAPAAEAGPGPYVKTGADKPMYKNALKLAMNGETAQARIAFNAFLTTFPNSSLTPNALYWRGECDYHEKRYARSIRSFQEVVDRFPKSHKAADALYKIGMARERLGDAPGAAAAFQELVDKHPGSELSGAARSKVGRLSRE